MELNQFQYQIVLDISIVLIHLLRRHYNYVYFDYPRQQPCAEIIIRIHIHINRCFFEATDYAMCKP